MPLTLTTYKNLFDDSLEESIAGYGDVTAIMVLVNMYQGSDPVARHYAFLDWLDGASFSCASCGEEFSPDMDEVEEDGCVLCPRCL